MSLLEKKIGQLVEENLNSAAILYEYGIKFYDCSDITLGEACHNKGLYPTTVLQRFDHQNSPTCQKISLEEYPIPMIIEYLKHAHHQFIKSRLPFMRQLITDFQCDSRIYSQVINDLKWVFPLFAEDFIHHIYEEEDTIFQYISFLDKATKSKFQTSRVYYQMERFSMEAIAEEHADDDDEMLGIRNITHNYYLKRNTPLEIQVLYNELQGFEQELREHAALENNVLFPKAITLEKELKKVLTQKIICN